VDKKNRHLIEWCWSISVGKTGTHIGADKDDVAGCAAAQLKVVKVNEI
jgi:hypothetical protein